MLIIFIYIYAWYKTASLLFRNSFKLLIKYSGQARFIYLILRMAACTRWKVFFPVLILCVSLLGMAVSVSGDAALIEDVCSKTTRPDHCKACYKLNSKSSQENVKDLGRLSIGCVFLELGIFRSTLGSLLKNTNDMGPEFLNACTSCSTMLVSVDKRIKDSLEAWQQARYETSTMHMWYAVSIINDCRGGLRMMVGLPKSLADQIIALDGFGQASYGVLDQIH
ncbi:uncharacterized protein LOC109003393 isoform X2 [Juglans regia]|uniref:Uncharacterized protein LOC109003393 isoform X2 n=1 Tax=Juglans regia TaxID=51240 RepID=A0A6P9E0Y6_JUGRE|nr:uncharacterized protein LOC109003393 isoform X2 [Juglans regia]